MKKNISKILITTLAISSMLSITALAQDTQINAEINVSNITENETKSNEYTIEKGTISSITIEGEYAQIEITNDNMGLIFTTLLSTPVFDAKDGSIKTVKDLQQGMVISGILPDTSATTMSIPPMTPSAIAFLVNSDNVNVVTSKFNDELISLDNSLQLNIGENTTIVSLNGSRQILTAEDIKGNNAIAIYDISTRSIPAQTTPSMVILLPSQDETMSSEYKSDEGIVSSIQIEEKYTIEKGTISSITIEGEYAQIEITNDNMGLVFTTLLSTPVFDAKDSSVKTVKDLQQGMVISGILPNTSITTMSIPPMTPSAIAFLVNSDNVNVVAGNFNDELINLDNSLQLNIGENTSIVSLNGSRQILTAEDIKGNNAIVIYDISTKSIPAQTTPSMVILLPNKNKTDNGEIVEYFEYEPSIDENNEIYLLPLRETVEQSGFTINWKSNDSPVTIEKDNILIEVKLNSTEFNINGETKEFKKPVIIHDGSMSVSSEILEYLQ